MGCIAPKHRHHSRQYCSRVQKKKIVMWAVRLVAMGVFESIVLCYPQKGHTHGPLDGVFGQMCVKLSLAEFQDDMDVVNILDQRPKIIGARHRLQGRSSSL